MSNIRNKLKIVILTALSPLTALAQQSVPAPVTSLSGIAGLICTAANWLFTFFIVIAILLFMLGAYVILTSAGSRERSKNGSNAVLYAIIAIIVALLAKGFPIIIGSFFGATFQGC